jgi:hypothetical protein
MDRSRSILIIGFSGILISGAVEARGRAALRPPVLAAATLASVRRLLADDSCVYGRGFPAPPGCALGRSGANRARGIPGNHVPHPDMFGYKLEFKGSDRIAGYAVHLAVANFAVIGWNAKYGCP